MFLAQVEHLAAQDLVISPDDEQVNAFEELENPAHGRCLGVFADLVRQALSFL